MPLYYFHRYQVTAAVKLIGGVEYQYALKEDLLSGNQNNSDAKAITIVSTDKQKQALHALLKTLDSKALTLPESIIKLIPPKAYGSYKNRETGPSKTGLVFDPITLAAASANHSLSGLLSTPRLSRIAQQSVYLPQLWTLTDYLSNIVDNTIKTELTGGHASLVQQRIAAVTIEKLIDVLQKPETPVEVKADVFTVLAQLNVWLKQELNNPSSGHRGFYRVLAHHLDWYFEHRKWLPLTDMSRLPPGSPI